MRCELSASLAALMMGCAISLSAQTSTPATPPAKHGMVLDDIAKLARVGEPEISPDGAWIAYTVGEREYARR